MDLPIVTDSDENVAIAKLNLNQLLLDNDRVSRQVQIELSVASVRIPPGRFGSILRSILKTKHR